MKVKGLTFPVYCWGKKFHTPKCLYEGGPTNPRVGLKAFCARLELRIKIKGGLCQEDIKKALNSRPHQYDGGGFIYEVTHIATNMKYIGISTNPEAREKAHFRESADNDSFLSRAIKKYGKDAFTFKIIAVVDALRMELRRIETALIEMEKCYHPNGFNARWGDLKRK